MASLWRVSRTLDKGPMTAPTLTTQRLSIEPMSRAHWEDYAAAWADPSMTAFIGG